MKLAVKETAKRNTLKTSKKENTSQIPALITR